MRAGIQAFCLIGAVLASGVPARPQVEWHVATDGSDESPGTIEKPFGTVARAQRAVRQAIAAGIKADLTVVIHGGTYELAEPLLFGPADSGSPEHSITYAAHPGEAVTVSGGRRITGWRQEGRLWAADVPGVREGAWYFRQLFVDGHRGTRARTPNGSDGPPYWQMTGAEPTNDPPGYRLTLGPGQLSRWRNLTDVELVTIGSWATTRGRLHTVEGQQDPVRAVISVPPGKGHSWNHPAAGRWCFLENAAEFLDEPGEWYLDRESGVLTYWPRAGQHMARAEVVAPVLTRLVGILGTAEQPVRNLHFEGLTFAYTDWPIPQTGYQGLEASHFWSEDSKAARPIEAAVCLEFAESCSLSRGSVRGIGGVAVALRRGCRRNLVHENRVVDVGGTGVSITGPNDPVEAPRDNRVTSNHIYRCGLDHFGALGISIGLAQGTAAAHNHVHHVPWVGIALGWSHTSEPTVCRGNIVEYNHIHDVMTELADGGGIGTLGFQPGTVLRGNVIHDVPRSPFTHGLGNHGIRFDDGSAGIALESNIIYRTAGDPMRYHEGDQQKRLVEYYRHAMAARRTARGGRLEAAEAAMPHVVQAAAASGCKWAEAQAHELWAEILLTRGELEGADGRLAEAHQARTGLGNGVRLVSPQPFGLYAQVSYARGKLEEAIGLEERAVEAAEGAEDIAGQAEALAALAVMYHETGRSEDGLRAGEKAAELAKQIGTGEADQEARSRLAALYYDLGDTEEAEVIETGARRVRRSRSSDWAAVLRRRAASRYRAGEYTGAIRLLKQAQKIDETLGRKLALVDDLNALAACHLGLARQRTQPSRR